LLVNRDYVVESLYRDHATLNSFSYTNAMEAITLPVLFLWGRHDGIVPLTAGEAAWSSIGTPESDRHFVVLDESGHYPFIEEPEAIATFVAVATRAAARG
jgi:pimeloyl-ACP methyl ester carboxylesterase